MEKSRGDRDIVAGIGHSSKLPKLWECIGRLDETTQAAYVEPAALSRVFPDLALFGISQFRSTRLQSYTTWNSHENPAEGGRLHVSPGMYTEAL